MHDVTHPPSMAPMRNTNGVALNNSSELLGGTDESITHGLSGVNTPPPHCMTHPPAVSGQSSEPQCRTCGWSQPSYEQQCRTCGDMHSSVMP